MTEESTATPTDRLWTIHDVSYFLGVPIGTLHYWHHIGDGPACARIGRHLRYRATDVQSWVDGRTRAS